MKKKKKLKIAFGIFFGIVAVSIASGLMFLESQSFGNRVKRFIAERAPQTMGLTGDFSNVKLYFFPPGIGVENPRLVVQKKNVSNLPIEANIEAKELRLHFEPFQMLSGTLQVSSVVVKDGSVSANVGAEALRPKNEPKKKSSGKLSWDQLLELQINGVEFENTFLSVQLELPDFPGKRVKTEFVVKHLNAHKERVKKKGVLATTGFVNAVKVDVPGEIAKLPVREASELEWNLEVTDEGITLNPFRAKLAGVELVTKGKLRGDILDPKSKLDFDLAANANADLQTFFSSNKISDEFKGSVQAKMNITGDLKSVEKTVVGQYHLLAKDFQWKDVRYAEVEGEGRLNLPANQIQVRKIALFEKVDRNSGGQIELDNANLMLAAPLDHLEAKITIKDAPVHWAGAYALKSVYPLGGKISGTAEVKSSKGKLEIFPELAIQNFVLNNQKYHKEKPMSYILQPRETVNVKGKMAIKPEGVEFKDFIVSLKKTRFEAYGSINKKDEFDLHAKGNLDLADIDRIAESPCRGEGPLNTWVHGTGDAIVIDFDPDVKDAQYLGLKFGDLKGRVTFDDAADELRFQNIQIKKNGTFYSVKEGLVDLSDASEINIPFNIHTGRVEDLAQILEPVVKKVSWYPPELKGEVRGRIDLKGKTNFANMVIDSQLEGTDWALYGEKFRKLKMNVGYDEGTYYARNVSIAKAGGLIKGMIDFDSRKELLDWSFATENFSLSDIDFFERLEIPARSKIEVKSTGTGKINHLVSKSSGKFFQTQIKGETLDPSSFNLEVGESVMKASLDVFGDRLHSQLKYALLPKQPSSLSIDFNQFDFSPVLLILNPKLLDDPNLLSLVDGSFNFDFLSTQSELARGQIALRKYILKKTGFSLALDKPIQTPIQLGYFSIAPSVFKFNESEVVLSGEGKRGDVDLQLKGEVDLGLAEIFSSSIQKVTGKAPTELHISGPLKDLKVNGDFHFTNAYLMMRWLQTPFEEMDGSIQIRKNVIYVQNIDAFLGEEVFSMNGKIETYTQQFPKIELHTQFDDNKVKMLPLEFAQVRGNASIKGDRPPYTISGMIDVVQALWTKSFSSSTGISARADRFAPVSAEKQNASGLFTLDLAVNANQGFLVRNEVMDGEFKGKVKLIGSPENPKMLGDGQLVQGKVLFRDRPFILESVKIDFDDPYNLNPKFNAAAVSEVNQYKIRVLAYGRSNSWKADFSSTPYLSENEIFSLLASGLTTTANSRFRTRDRSYVNQGEAASLVLHSMDFGKDVQNKTGFQFDVEEAVDTQSANSIFRPQSTSDNVAAPKLVLKRQVGRRVGLSFGSTVGVGNQVQREVNAEYKLNNAVSVQGVWNNIQGSDNNSRETRTSFGLDLKLNRRFK